MTTPEEAREIGVPEIVVAGPLIESVAPCTTMLWLLRGWMVWPPIVNMGFEVGAAAGIGVGMAKVWLFIIRPAEASERSFEDIVVAGPFGERVLPATMIPEPACGMTAKPPAWKPPWGLLFSFACGGGVGTAKV